MKPDQDSMTSPPSSSEDTPKWNFSGLSELLIPNTREDYNLTQNIYRVVKTLDESENNCNKSVNFSDVCKNNDEYDGIEISVVIVLFLLIVVTVIGNTLIIAAVVTTKRLRTVTNCFVTSLAAADLLVGIFVMPPAIAVHISGE